MIHYFQPFATDKNLGREFNRCASMVDDPEDWLCFTDRDTLIFPTVPEIGVILDEIVSGETIKHSNIGLLTCMTNRVGYRDQCVGKQISNETNILKHFKIAQELLIQRAKMIHCTSDLVSGCMMLIKKKTWDEVGGAKDGLYGVDHDLLKKLLVKGYQFGIMRGIYLFHHYRFHKYHKDISHLTTEDDGRPYCKPLPEINRIEGTGLKKPIEDKEAIEAIVGKPTTKKRTMLHTKSQALALLDELRSICPDVELIGGLTRKDISYNDIDVYLPMEKTDKVKLQLIVLLDINQPEDVTDTDWGGWFFHNTALYGNVDVFFSKDDFDY